MAAGATIERLAVGACCIVASFDWNAVALAALQRRENVRLFRSLDGARGRAYVPAPDAPGERDAHADLAAAMHVQLVTLTLDRAGASHGSDAPYHYVVTTDILPDAEADMNAWYDTEHLPGLAAVPGTVRARRYRAVDADTSPRHHAAYDLAALEAHDSPPWLAVKATAWSSRVRPSFRHTSRAMYERVR